MAAEMNGVLVKDWMDLYQFLDGPVQLECPDCYAPSPPLPDIYAAARWVAGHYRECPA